MGCGGLVPTGRSYASLPSLVGKHHQVFSTHKRSCVVTLSAAKGLAGRTPRSFAALRMTAVLTFAPLGLAPALARFIALLHQPHPVTSVGSPSSREKHRHRLLAAT